MRAMFWGAEWEKEGEKLGKQVKGCYQGTGGSSGSCWVPTVGARLSSWLWGDTELGIAKAPHTRTHDKRKAGHILKR